MVNKTISWNLEECKEGQALPKGTPLPLLSEWLGHAQLETTMIYAYADTKMKREAIEKATSSINPLKQGQEVTSWQDDDDLIKRLYGLQ